MSHSQAFGWVRDGAFRPQLIAFLRQNPAMLKTPPPGSSSTILHEVVACGNVPLFQEILKIPGVWFPLDIKDSANRTLRDSLESGKASGLSEATARVMETYLNFLTEWDTHCEYAKYYLESENERVWAWLRRNSRNCYTVPPSRKWSIAMQVVYSGNLEWFQNLLRLCPAMPQHRGGPNVWEMRGNDGMTLLDVAQEVSDAFPDMYQFVFERTNPHTVAAVVQAVAPPPVVDDLAPIRAMWGSIDVPNIRRPIGECLIMRTGDREPLFACSRDCTHAYGMEGLRGYLQTRLRSGPFPVRCPDCTAEGQDRGILTRGPLKALAAAGVITENEAQRLLKQQHNHIPDEASLDLQYSMSKPCPFCQTPVAHYKGHGCHHIRPGGGCPSCHNHFCYTCLSAHGDGSTWQGCPNDDPLFCNADCDCPLCPDCTPGNPCDFCDGPNGACPRCRRV